MYPIKLKNVIKMKNYWILFLLCSTPSFLWGQQDSLKNETKIKVTETGVNIGNLVEMSGDWYITYRDMKKEHYVGGTTKESVHTNEFILKRSYFTLKTDLSKTFSVRYTQDITIDKEGSDAGNVETRMKYLYLMAKPKLKSKVFTDVSIEVGMVHRPWLSYEQKINKYRVQGNMAVERNKLFNSADFGIMVAGNIGAKMDKKFLKEVSSAMKGKYLSYALGVYNGGGYAGEEKNINKVISGRLSYRPMPKSLPELHFSAYFNVGKGNTEATPDYNQFLGFATYTGRALTLTAQYQVGEGDYKGKYVYSNDKGRSLKNNGYSFFGEYKFLNTPWALWGRHDHFTLEAEAGDKITKRYIAGISYRINKHFRIVVDGEYSDNSGLKDKIVEMNMEISF